MLKIAILLLLQIQYATTATTKTATHNRLVVFFFLGAGKGEAEKKTVPRHDKVNHQQVPSRMCDVHGSERGITPLRKLTHETTRKKGCVEFSYGEEEEGFSSGPGGVVFCGRVDAGNED